MRFALIFTLCSAIILQTVTAYPSDDDGMEYIANGRTAQPGQFPYQVSLRIHDQRLGRFRHNCGGSIISDRWVLSAAHCTVSNPGQTITVKTLNIVVGAHHVSKDGTVHWLEKIINHPKYDRRTIANDISLLRTKLKIKLSGRVRVIPLDRRHIGGGENAVVSGWGQTQTRRLPDYLQYIRERTVSNEECQAAIGSGGGQIFPSSLCAGKLPKQTVCSGDSGGPLAIANKLVGVVSWGVNRCSGRRAPDVFARVSYYIGWIERVTGLRVA